MTDRTIDVSAVEVVDVRADRRDAAREMISSAARWSMAASFIPVPYIDLATLATLQTKLIVNLASLYDQKLSKQAVNGVITVLIGTLSPTGASQVTAGLFFKLVPGVGTVLGATSLALFSYAATHAVGKIFVRHFENGGTFSSFVAKDYQADLKMNSHQPRVISFLYFRFLS